MFVYQNHSEYLALLRGILECPEDDAPRLIIADWLEDNGHERYAEFIRKQIESSSLIEADGDETDVLNDYQVSVLSRIRQLWRDSQRSDSLLETFCLLMPDETELFLGEIRFSSATPRRRVSFRRGFASEIHLTSFQLMSDAKEIFAKWPISQVRLTNKQPWYLNLEKKFVWLRGNLLSESDIMPSLIYQEISHRHWLKSVSRHRGLSTGRFDTVSEAYLALSDACVDYGRMLVGLPPLKEHHDNQPE